MLRVLMGELLRWGNAQPGEAFWTRLRSTRWRRADASFPFPAPGDWAGSPSGCSAQRTRSASRLSPACGALGLNGEGGRVELTRVAEVIPIAHRDGRTAWGVDRPLRNTDEAKRLWRLLPGRRAKLAGGGWLGVRIAPQKRPNCGRANKHWRSGRVGFEPIRNARKEVGRGVSFARTFRAVPDKPT